MAPNANLSPMERMMQLTSGGMAEKKANFLNGDPTRVASQLVQLLKKEHIIPFLK